MTQVCAFAPIISPEPLFPDWNFRLLQALFHMLPHSSFRDTASQFLVENPLVSTFIFAASSYAYWRIEDNRASWRRGRLIVLAFVLCGVALVTLAIRPWIGWPAPVLSARFRALYPEDLWADGNPNCFPSHSTYIYLLSAFGLWRFNRKLGAFLAVWALALISLPRVYVGGHYPVDILAGAVLAGIALWIVDAVCKFAPARSRLDRIASAGLWIEILFFLWLFELAEGFRSSFWMLGIATHAAERLLHLSFGR